MGGIPVGLASVIVPCFDQLAFARQCVTALVRYTRPPWELNVVDNSSTDGTAIYLFTTSAAGPSLPWGSTRNRCSMRTTRGSRPSGACPRRMPRRLRASCEAPTARARGVSLLKAETAKFFAHAHLACVGDDAPSPGRRSPVAEKQTGVVNQRPEKGPLRTTPIRLPIQPLPVRLSRSRRMLQALSALCRPTTLSLLVHLLKLGNSRPRVRVPLSP